MLPIIIPLMTAASFAAGALSRQPEINKLKEQVRALQAQIVKLREILAEQQRQIEEMKIRYAVLKADNYIEKRRALGITKGFLYVQYGLKEYIELTIQQSRGIAFQDAELRFFNAFNLSMTSQNVPVDAKLCIKEYIEQRYRYQIDNLISMGDVEQANLINKVKAE